MASIFSKIISGEIPSFKVYEDELCYAFLDIRPLKKGHTLVIPKQEIDYIFDIPDSLYSHLLLTAKKIAIGMKKVLPCEKIGMSVVGLEVPHAHIHLVPINSVKDMTFGQGFVQLSNEELAEIADQIAASI
jgi:histidine triad (HIT) family protein